MLFKGIFTICRPARIFYLLIHFYPFLKVVLSSAWFKSPVGSFSSSLHGPHAVWSGSAQMWWVENSACNVLFLLFFFFFLHTFAYVREGFPAVQIGTTWERCPSLWHRRHDSPSLDSSSLSSYCHACFHGPTCQPPHSPPDPHPTLRPQSVAAPLHRWLRTDGNVISVSPSALSPTLSIMSSSS